MHATAQTRLAEIANNVVTSKFAFVRSADVDSVFLGEIMPGTLLFRERDGVPYSFSQWIDTLHSELKQPYTLWGSKQVFNAMTAKIVDVLGWCPLAVACITLAWAYYYGSMLYNDLHGMFPVFKEKWLDACMTADCLNDVLRQEY